MKTATLILTLGIICMSLLPSVGYSNNAAASKQRVKLNIKVGNMTVSATLGDSDVARDFAALLPLTLDLKDYAGAEKISDLPRKLNIKGAPVGSDPSLGDIAYYAPWGNLAIFYKDSPYASGLVLLGRVDSDLSTLVSTSGRITIELGAP